jgi:hypothetical protein
MREQQRIVVPDLIPAWLRADREAHMDRASSASTSNLQSPFAVGRGSSRFEQNEAVLSRSGSESGAPLSTRTQG